MNPYENTVRANARAIYDSYTTEQKRDQFVSIIESIKTAQKDLMDKILNSPINSDQVEGMKDRLEVFGVMLNSYRQQLAALDA